MSLIQQRTPLSHEDEFKYAKLAMEWYGWGSPIGLGILLVLACFVPLGFPQA